jgi:hypothetical protein
MSIKTITRSEFNRLLPHNSALEHLMVEQVGWFSNTSGSVLGTIGRGKGVAGWNYVILKQEEKGGFCVRKVMSNFFALKPAKDDLLISMAELASERPAVLLGRD